MGGGVRGIESGVEVRSSEACSGEAGVRPWTLRSMAALRKRSRSSCITSTSPLYMKSKSRVNCLGGNNLEGGNRNRYIFQLILTFEELL